MHETVVSRPVLLVVGDERPILRVIGRLAAKVGFEAVTCTSCSEALRGVCGILPAWHQSESCRMVCRRSCCARSRTAMCIGSGRCCRSRWMWPSWRRPAGLRAEVAAGRFRNDLFYRLNVVGVTLPLLRDRPSGYPGTARRIHRRLFEALRETIGRDHARGERLW